MKSDELREQQLEVLMDLNRGRLCVSEANTKIIEIYALTEPKEQDVCPECLGDEYVNSVDKHGVASMILCPVCKQKDLGKAPVDKIREAFERDCHYKNIEFKNGRYIIVAYQENIGSYLTHVNAHFDTYSKAYKSQQAEIERLKAENEAMRCCGNCRSWEIDDCIYTAGSGYMCDDWQPKENN